MPDTNPSSRAPAHSRPHLELDAVPGPPVLPVIGSLPWILSCEGMMHGVAALGERFRREGLFRLGLPDGGLQLFVVNAALSTDVCDDSRWEKVLGGPVVRIREITEDGLFTAYGHEENWRRAHRIIAPGFTVAAMDRFFPAIRETAYALIEHWRRAPGPVDVVDDMTRLTLDTISLCGFGHRFHSFSRPALAPFLQALGRALQETVDSLQRLRIVPFYEAYKQRRFAADVAEMYAVVDALIVERRRLDRAAWPRDLLSLMLSEPDPKTGERLSDANIRHQILTFLIAGHETTAGLLSFTLHKLAADPVLAARLRDEVRRTIGDGEPTFEQVQGLDLVHRTLLESLRMWPTVPAVTRAPKTDCVLDRYRIPAGHPVTLLLPAIHRDPTIWSDPDRFDPDRFLPEASKGRPVGAYKPFGIGKRTCTGRHFALIEAALCIALVVREFELERPAPLHITPTASPKPRRFRLVLSPLTCTGRCGSSSQTSPSEAPCTA